MKIILFAGQAQHGKDTAARIAREYLENKGKVCLSIAYADYLKFVCEKYYGWDGKKDAMGRTVLQVVGTEKARANNPDIWVNVVIEFIKAFSPGVDYILVSDFRYPNEDLALKRQGWKTFPIWVHRRDFDNGMTAEQKAHRSETSLLDYPFSRVISVGNSMVELKDAVEKLMEKIGNDQ